MLYLKCGSCEGMAVPAVKEVVQLKAIELSQVWNSILNK